MEGGDLAAAEVEHLGKRKRAGELAMLQLRLARGLNYSDFSARTGQDACVILCRSNRSVKAERPSAGRRGGDQVVGPGIGGSRCDSRGILGRRGRVGV